MKSGNGREDNRMGNDLLYWSLLEHGEWALHLMATEEGICYIGSQNAPFEEACAWASAKKPKLVLVRDDNKLEPYEKAIARYLDGLPLPIDMRLSIKGTPFQEAVWQALREIPYGESRSYSQIADMIGKPAAVRAVGTAIGANPVLIAVPCHRVIGKNGSLTGYRGGLPMKSKLLELETAHK